MAAATRRHRAALAGLALPVLLLVALAGAAAPALAKEGLQATLDAPVPMDASPGTILLVGMTVVAPEGTELHPVEGSPIYLKLIGGDETSWGLGTEDRRGHYTMRIAVPSGGIRSIEVGMHGTSDLPIIVTGSPLVTGGITSRTAQAAPAMSAAPVPAEPVPVARASAPAPVRQPGASGQSTTAPAAPDLPAWMLALAVVGLGLAVVVALVAGLRIAGRPRPARRPRPVAPEG